MLGDLFAVLFLFGLLGAWLLVIFIAWKIVTAMVRGITREVRDTWEERP